MILKNCSKYMHKDQTVELNAEIENLIYKKALEVIGKKSARAIGVARVEVPSDFKSDDDFEEYEKEMTFLGVFGIMDPVRNDVPNAVLTCHKA